MKNESIKKENAKWIKNTTVKEEDLKCWKCDAELEIIHCSNHHDGTGIFYTVCNDCGLQQNVSWSIKSQKVKVEKRILQKAHKILTEYMDAHTDGRLDRLADIRDYEFLEELKDAHNREGGE
jgi:hypothetical protein